MVYPLIESLAHPMVARESHMFNQVSSRRSYSQLLDLATLKTKRSGSSFFRFRAQGNTVRSVQRLNLPTGKDAVWVKQRYLTWLPRFLAPLILVDVEGSRITFALLTKKLKMLELYRDEERSDRDRQLLYIVDGRLVAQKQGCLEFRVVLNRRFVLASIHEFRPALPWYLYVLTQAKLHLWVMSAFGRDLKS